MSKEKRLLALCVASMLCATGCGDDATSSVAGASNQCDPACPENQMCFKGQCVDRDQPEPPKQECTAPQCRDDQTYCQNGVWKACGDGLVCDAGTCTNPDSHACKTGKCSGDGKSLCVDGEWQPCQSEEVCLDGACRILEDNECEPGACSEDGLSRCNEEGRYEICGSGMVCEQSDGHSECVIEKTNDPATLWTICNNDSDCTHGICLFFVSTTDGQSLRVSELDARVGEEQGVCSRDCTTSASNCTPAEDPNSNMTCQLLAVNDKGLYPPKNEAGEALELPFDNDIANLVPVYAALCRPADRRETYYKNTFCKPCEVSCSEGEVCVDGFCTMPCEDASACPIAFQCVERDDQKVCMPPAGVCGDWLDGDGDGQGWGHCPSSAKDNCDNTHYDCDDTNAMYYFGRDIDPNTSHIRVTEGTELTCDDYNNGYSSDFNCNGLIDRVELLGTTQNCTACGDVCATNDDAATAHMYATCKESNDDASTSGFVCETPCELGYADCDGDRANGCEVQLYDFDGKDSLPYISDDNNNRTYYVDPAMIQNDASVYLMDSDGDKAYRLEENVTKAIKKPALDPSTTRLCCKTGNTDTCYAPRDWASVVRDDALSLVDESTDLMSLMSFETASNDNNAANHPGADDICDGEDNDSSEIALSGQYSSCSTYCATHASECKNFTTSDGKYLTNVFCNTTPDGIADTFKGYKNQSTPQAATLKLNDLCGVSGENNGKLTICSERGLVRCVPSMNSLSCVDENLKENSEKLDGSITPPAFDGVDEDCDGMVDEDDYRPCIITGNNQYELVTSKEYDYIGSNGKLLNTDGSINVCRLGYMTGPKTCTSIDENLRKNKNVYDLYGDGIDADCDGYDYDLDKAIFVDANSGSDKNSGNYSNPVFTLAQALNKAKDDSVYRDILSSQSNYPIIQNDTVKIPTTSEIKALYSINEFPTKKDEAGNETWSKYKENTDYNQYRLWYAHKWLAEQRRDRNPKLYRFETTNRIEVNKPQEFIRLYGGFVKSSNTWESSDKHTEVSMTIDDNIINNKNKGTRPQNIRFIMLESNNNNPLSIRIENMKFTMATNNVTLPANFVNGATFIGLNAEAGAKRVILNNTEIHVRAADGYSFDASGNAGSGTFGNNAKHGHDGKRGASSTGDDGYKKTFKCYNTYFNTTIDGSSSFPSLHDNQGFNQAYDFTCKTVNSNDAICTYRNDEMSTETSKTGFGGVGGIADGARNTTKLYKGQNGYASGDGTSGGAGCIPNSLKDNSLSGDAFTETRCGTLGCAKESKPIEFSGNPGQNGESGKNGAQPADLIYKKDDNGVYYVYSDRSKGHGKHGAAGGGGGGGGVANAYKKTAIAENSYCTSGGGGDGGCGGNGGRSGGTGGSAIGMLLTSTNSTDDSLVIELNNNSGISVEAGNGGIGQNGGDGMPGGHGGIGETRLWKSGVWRVCEDRTGGPGGGGGGGGAGAGGRAGLANPIVLVTHTSSCKQTLTGDTWVLDDGKSSWCGVSITYPVNKSFRDVLKKNSPKWYGLATTSYVAGAINNSEGKSCDILCSGMNTEISSITCSTVSNDDCNQNFGKLLRINGRKGISSNNDGTKLTNDPSVIPDTAARDVLNDALVKRVYF